MHPVASLSRDTCIDARHVTEPATSLALGFSIPFLSCRQMLTFAFLRLTRGLNLWVTSSEVVIVKSSIDHWHVNTHGKRRHLLHHANDSTAHTHTTRSALLFFLHEQMSERHTTARETVSCRVSQFTFEPSQPSYLPQNSNNIL